MIMITKNIIIIIIYIGGLQGGHDRCSFARASGEPTGPELVLYAVQ